MVRVLIVDDPGLVAEGLGALLTMVGEMDVVGCASTVDDAVVLAGRERPDVALIDYHLLDGDGIEAGRRIRYAVPQVGLVMLARSPEHAAVTGAVEAGFNSIVLTTATSRELIAALHAGGRGEAHFSPEVLNALVRSQRATTLRDELTARELEIVALMAKGRSTAGMAEQLSLSPHTVRNHVRNILGKLGAHSKLEAVVVASRLGLVDVGS